MHIMLSAPMAAAPLPAAPLHRATSRSPWLARARWADSVGCRKSMVVYGMADGRLIELSCQNVAKQAGGELASSDGDRWQRPKRISAASGVTRQARRPGPLHRRRMRTWNAPATAHRSGKPVKRVALELGSAAEGVDGSDDATRPCGRPWQFSLGRTDACCVLRDAWCLPFPKKALAPGRGGYVRFVCEARATSKDLVTIWAKH
jgi:hypothetical protein